MYITTKRGLTRRQARVIQLFLNDPNKSKAKAIREAGYSDAVARQPHKVFASPAVLDELEKRGYNTLGIRLEARGLNVEEGVEFVEPLVAFDPSRLSVEAIQDLKDKLGAVQLPAQVPEPEYSGYARAPMSLGETSDESPSLSSM
jgi:hypothetical protein